MLVALCGLLLRRALTSRRLRPRWTPGYLPQATETEIQKAVLGLLAVHPAVGWAQRMNTGAMTMREPGRKDRFIKFGFVGMSDILGQMKDGRFLAVEVKVPGNEPTPEQARFLQSVQQFGGVAFVARSVDDVAAALK